jgi:hypothetical protein
MKSPMEILRLKEQEIQKLRKEIDALRLTARLLFDEGAGPVAIHDEPKQDRRQLVEVP